MRNAKTVTRLQTSARTGWDNVPIVPGTAHQRLSDYTIVWIEGGSGVYQVDFQNYSCTGERILFLGPEQYFSVVSGSIPFRQIAVPASVISNDSQLASASRVLFTHIYEVGAIDLSHVPGPHPHLDLRLTDSDDLRRWLYNAARHWSDQRPLHPQITQRETDVIFDLRHLIELSYREQRPVGEYAITLGVSARKINSITTSRIKRTLGELVQSRQILAAKRELVFSEKSVKEIAYELDFADPAYFSRFFARSVGAPPTAFREAYADARVDPFLDDLGDLVEENFRRTRAVAFYAEQLFMTPKALSAKVKRLTGKPLSEMLKERTAVEARRLLTSSSMSVQDISTNLGFTEPAHFSHFFKKATAKAPSTFREKH